MTLSAAYLPRSAARFGGRPAVLSTVLCFVLLVAFAAAPLALGIPKPPDLDLKINIAVPQQAVATGAEAEAVVSITPPAGVKLNKYPPIRVTVEGNPPIEFEQTTVKVGLDEMPENAELNHFDTIEPIHLKFKVGKHNGDGKIPIRGKVKLTYCVAKSGYCAPVTKDLSFAVPIQAAD